MSDFNELLEVIEKHRKRANQAKYLEAKAELANELYPLISTIVEAMGERLDEVEGQVAALIEQTMSVIQPDLATQILGTMSLAAQLADAIDTSKDTKEIIDLLRVALRLTEESVLDACVEEEGEEEGEESVEVANNNGEIEEKVTVSPSPIDSVNAEVKS